MISSTYANAAQTLVSFVDHAGAIRSVAPDWPGEFRNEAVDGGGVIGFLAAGGVIAPYVAPPKSAEQLRIGAFKADPTRANLITLIQGSTPAQIDTWLTNNVTTLAQARNVLGQLIKLVGGNSVS